LTWAAAHRDRAADREAADGFDWADWAALDILGDGDRMIASFDDDDLWWAARCRLADVLRSAGWIGRLAAWLLGADTAGGAS
jgi:hypothetical protein